ncbi:hypothetical protein AAFF_G00344230 [Aldrovandia affinis]|uniref:Uncharacterized protein n=1 Tax=Aldrovandia affinis TaxID=143900 RepID=A0AAD7SKN8_9TELE|nr:hypothetical protein AAFF_G00344230 [Aldrovandia affinis]
MRTAGSAPRPLAGVIALLSSKPRGAPEAETLAFEQDPLSTARVSSSCFCLLRRRLSSSVRSHHRPHPPHPALRQCVDAQDQEEELPDPQRVPYMLALGPIEALTFSKPIFGGILSAKSITNGTGPETKRPKSVFSSFSPLQPTIIVSLLYEWRTPTGPAGLLSHTYADAGQGAFVRADSTETSRPDGRFPACRSRDGDESHQRLKCVQRI